MTTCNSNENKPSFAEIEQAKALFNEAATLAESVMNLANSIVVADSEPSEAEVCGVTVSRLATTARELAAKIGWVSDHGHKILGGGLGVRGSAENWLLPPIYHMANKEN